jgi:hypothetical protein
MKDVVRPCEVFCATLASANRQAHAPDLLWHNLIESIVAKLNGLFGR